MTTLEAELELVTGYLEIQKFRFGDKLEYQIKVAEGAQTFPLLPLTIQPLVENAVVHGLEKKEAKGGFGLRFPGPVIIYLFWCGTMEWG